MKRLIFSLIILVFLNISMAVAAKENPDGELLYNNYCAKCHGIGAVGTDKGPPLVHRIYRPGHHADYSFYLAASKGVRRHHWGFGDMPPVKGVTKEDVDMIIKYVRGLQKEAGLLR